MQMLHVLGNIELPCNVGIVLGSSILRYIVHIFLVPNSGNSRTHTSTTTAVEILDCWLLTRTILSMYF